MDVRAYNRRAWNNEVAKGNRWTVAVSADEIACARAGDWHVLLTPTEPVPRSWFGDLKGARVLGLASAGGQQGPILAAAGAQVTVIDNAPAQLARDREVAQRDGLSIECIEGDMADLSMFEDGSFDLVFHPVSNCFVPDVRPVWREAYRVLRPGGALLSGFCNPVMFIFDDRAASERGALIVQHTIPYSDVTSLTEEELQRYVEEDAPLSFGHSLGDLIGGQLDMGLAIVGMYEDHWDAPNDEPLDRYLPCFIATHARKPSDA